MPQTFFSLNAVFHFRSAFLERDFSFHEMDFCPPACGAEVFILIQHLSWEEIIIPSFQALTCLFLKVTFIRTNLCVLNGWAFFLHRPPVGIFSFFFNPAKDAGRCLLNSPPQN